MIKNVHIYSISGFKIDKIKIHNLLSFLIKQLNISINSLEINFINSKEIKRLNKKHLSHDHSTDILTFGYSDTKEEIDGEIFISIDDAKENSKTFNVSLQNELFRLVIHGILHLIGYDDIKEADRKEMKYSENLLLNNFCKL